MQSSYFAVFFQILSVIIQLDWLDARPSVLPIFKDLMDGEDIVVKLDGVHYDLAKLNGKNPSGHETYKITEVDKNGKEIQKSKADLNIFQETYLFAVKVFTPKNDYPQHEAKFTGELPFQNNGEEVVLTRKGDHFFPKQDKKTLYNIGILTTKKPEKKMTEKEEYDNNWGYWGKIAKWTLEHVPLFKEARYLVYGDPDDHFLPQRNGEYLWKPKNALK